MLLISHIIIFKLNKLQILLAFFINSQNKYY